MIGKIEANHGRHNPYAGAHHHYQMEAANEELGGGSRGHEHGDHEYDAHCLERDDNAQGDKAQQPILHSRHRQTGGGGHGRVVGGEQELLVEEGHQH